MTEVDGGVLEDTLALHVAEVHRAKTVVRRVDDLFGAVTRKLVVDAHALSARAAGVFEMNPPLADTRDSDAESSMMTSVWVAPLRELRATEVIGVAPGVAKRVEGRAKVESRRLRWRGWMLVGLAVVGVLACVVYWLTQPRVLARAIKREHVTSVASVGHGAPRAVVQVPMSDDERARQEAAAAAALVAGDRALSLARYRALAASTGDATFACVVRILEATP